MSPSALVRDRFTWLAYGQIAAFGYFFYGFGPVVPLLRLEQHTSRGVAGLHGTAFALGGILCGVLTPVLVRRFGRQVTLWTGLVGLSASIGGFWVVRPLWGTLPLAVVASLFGTFVVIILMAALADHHGGVGPAALSEANAVGAGIGLLAPSAAGFALCWLAPFAWPAIAGLVVLGLGNALHFPLVIALLIAHSDGQPDLAVSRSTTASSLAFGVAPFVLGVVADRVGPHTAFLLVPLFLAGAATAAWRLRGRTPAVVPAPVPVSSVP